MTHSVWAWVETEQGLVKESSLEVLGEARRLADQFGISVVAVCVAGMAPAESLGPRGADIELMVLGPEFDGFTVEGSLEAAAAAIRDYPPQAVLLAASARGSALAPRLAAHFGWGYAPHSVMFEGEVSKGLGVRQSVMGGKADGLLSFEPGATVVVTFPPGLIGLDPPEPRRASERVVLAMPDAVHLA
ncbi:MAG: hypothetical protein LBE08_10535, partial [Bifidobacteriaceae bacterium]|nr:hypothetical protein [Bifidobacteriaceae bacterium]